MMADAKVVSLSVSPFRASQLCFEVGGILGESNVELGTKVDAFDFVSFYATLGSLQTFPNLPANLLYDFLEIQASVKPFTLAALRAESAKAALHKAVNARANAYFAKYADIPGVISKMKEYYDPQGGSKTERLDILRSVAEQQCRALADAYAPDRLGVVRNTESEIHITSTSRDTSISSQGTFNEQPAPDKIPVIRYTDSIYQDNLEAWQRGGFQADTKFQNAIVESQGDVTQTVKNTDYGYRMPNYENAAQNHRAQISLMDEQFALFMSTRNFKYLKEVFQNELNSIDMDVFQLQIAYLNTILMSPIAGIVTGVYKYPGDGVTPGEPVIRVEDNSNIFLVASLVYPGPISVGSTLTVQSHSTLLAHQQGMTGSVVAIRGQDQDDRWSVIAKCHNLDAQGHPILPPAYRFDYDDTLIVIS
jgi:hypothetical protein